MNGKREAPGENRNRDAGEEPDKSLPESGPEARLLELARGGDREAQFTVADLYALGDEGFPFDEAESARWLRAAAEQGHPVAQRAVGEAYYDGDAGEPDFARAAKWFRAAAKAGDLEAQFHLGRMYWREEADMEEDPDAESWLAVAADVGYHYASFLWADILGHYDDGTLPRPDEPESFQRFRRAAAAGVRAAKRELGFAYLKGEVVRRDEEEAAKWLRKAAMQGCRDSQLVLGVIALGGGKG